ncbi:uncharacterized protein PHACADRAFT_246248 [Phanerochaete carnosa HHB-10118-sp]|uniref:B30.2/SPRY domain-containing protein n=1 Tax=Phanerochaete carnosa (strain HHB-10118-sp) TaxID=650164 RepID=K5VBT5_PHACS|nr:uncharacterized protein PHACADRAFT_246248 [Phanerochaete carnosa HHB-10118-sp]EKM60371.1 hypothetical protein PHACADRAFT_246248 [Phanerochaete carnosa HHB-10118-sp]
MVGWDRQSWGYHADDGWVFPDYRSDYGPYGPTFDRECRKHSKQVRATLDITISAGDVIGCGIDFSQHKMFYTKNGTLLGA